MFCSSKTTGHPSLFETVIAVLERVRPLLDNSAPSERLAINGLDLARDFGIEHVL
jgi:hypothetical protein